VSQRAIYLFLTASLILTIILFLPIISLIVSTSPEEYVQAATNMEVLLAIFLSILSATIATIMAIILGVPFAYILARYEFAGRSIIEEMLDLPIMLPHTVAGIALLSLFGPRALIGSALANIGVYFVDTLLGIVLAQFFVSAPLLIKSALASFRSIDISLVKVARSLGGSQIRVFLDIELPLAMRGIGAGTVMCWMRAVSEFGAVIILAYYPMTAPILIYVRFTTQGLSASRPIAALMLIVTLIMFVVLKYLSNPRRH